MRPRLGAGEGPGGDRLTRGNKGSSGRRQRSLWIRGRAGDRSLPAGRGQHVRLWDWARREATPEPESQPAPLLRPPLAHPLPVGEGPGQTAGAEGSPFVGKLCIALCSEFLLCEAEKRQSHLTGWLRSLDETTADPETCCQRLTGAPETAAVPAWPCLTLTLPRGSPEVVLPFHGRRSQSGSGTYEKLPVTQGRLDEDLGCPSFYSHFLVVWNLTHSRITSCD